MFLVDKYSSFYTSTINNILSYCYKKNEITSDILNLPNDKLLQKLNELENTSLQYTHFQHLIFYNSSNLKEHVINILLEKIYNKTDIKTQEIEYMVSGYSNTKTKIMIKQSKNHIIIEPNSNGFDKYLIQEIIQEYAKSELLNIFKNNNLFKVVIINKIDNLSLIAQASLRRTMEKYSNICKFILVSNQLSKIIEPIRSRCLLIRVPYLLDEEILEIILTISMKENILLDNNDLYNIMKNSNNNIINAIWLLEMKKYNIEYNKNWEVTINNIVDLILSKKKILYIIRHFREYFYILFITNIPSQLIIRNIMINLLNKITDINFKYDIINITSIYERRLSNGTRHIIHIETYIIELIFLFTNKKI